MLRKIILNFKKTVLQVSFFSILSLLFCFCQSDPPLFTESPYADKAEFESVWQFIKAFSIYQDSSIYQGRIPENPFIFSRPEEMFDWLADTLKGSLYTHYTDASEYYKHGLASAITGSSPLVTFKSLTAKTGLITISTFMGDSIYRQFLGCVNQIPPTCENLIIDLRRNTGGSIPEVDSVVGAFLPVGKAYIMARERIRELRSSPIVTRDWHPWYTHGEHSVLKGKKLIVWMDGFTASASEILAAALKDCASARLVGSRSFGKGIGQVILIRNKRLDLQITYLQLRGMSNATGYYHGTGLKPDVEISGVSEEEKLSSVIRLFEPMYTGSITINSVSSVHKEVVPAGYKIIYEDSLCNYQEF